MFVFNGVSSDDMDVIVEEEDVFLARAAQRYDKIEIEGRNGAIFDEQGYSVVEKNMSLQILDDSKLDKILSWLNGSGVLEYKDRITKARFYNQIDPQRIVNIKTADVTFIRNPFWTKKRDNYVTVENMIYNEGNIYAEPIIRLEKTTTNNVDITIGNIRFVYSFDSEKYVEIDCEEQTVEYEGLNRNRKILIGYDFPKIMPGINKIIIHSGDAKIKIRRKDRWL